MPKVKAKARCFIDNALREAGDVFDYSGEPTSCMEVVEEKTPESPAKDAKVKKGKE